MPDGNIIFCSNHEYKRGFPFNMYTMTTYGKNIEKVTRDKGFDAFPMFSPDGKKILFSVTVITAEPMKPIFLWLTGSEL